MERGDLRRQRQEETDLLTFSWCHGKPAPGLAAPGAIFLSGTMPPWYLSLNLDSERTTMCLVTKISGLLPLLLLNEEKTRMWPESARQLGEPRSCHGPEGKPPASKKSVKCAHTCLCVCMHPLEMRVMAMSPSSNWL